MPVQPPLEFIPPAFNPWVLRGVKLVLPTVMQRQGAIASLQTQNIDCLISAYQQFQSGKIRLLLAFRHPSADDPLCLMQLMNRELPRAAQMQGQPLNSPSHFHFLYDRGIPLWAGDWVGWVYARLGGIPILRGKVDLRGLRTAREILTEGQFPLAVAPEGATNGHSEIVSPIEPGLAQLAVWAVEDLRKAGREQETVVILPIGIRYSYGQGEQGQEPWGAIAQLLTQLEQDSGLSSPPATTANSQTLYPRLYRLAQSLLQRMEDFYRQFYQQPITPFPDVDVLEADAFAQRLQTLLDVALKVSESYFGIEAKGSIIDRCRRLEQAGWDRIYRDDLKDLSQLSPLERGLADRVAEEAQQRLWHMRIVESFVAVTGTYVREKPTPERFGESALLMWDLMAKLKGETSLKRPKLCLRQAQITIGEAISATDLYDQAQQETPSRRASRKAVKTITQTLQTTLQSLATT